MFYLRKTDQLLFDGGEDELDNEWSFVSESGNRISVSLNRFIEHPLHSLQEHLSETTDFAGLIKALNARKSSGISGHYCTKQGIELFWLMEAFKSRQSLVIVSFGEVNPGRYRLVVEGEFS